MLASALYRGDPVPQVMLLYQSHFKDILRLRNELIYHVSLCLHFTPNTVTGIS